MYRAKLAKGITLTTIEGKSVLFSVRTGETYGLNDTAAAMLEALLATDSESAAKTCAARYEVVADEIATDLRGVVDELASLKLLDVK